MLLIHGNSSAKEYVSGQSTNSDSADENVEKKLPTRATTKITVVTIGFSCGSKYLEHKWGPGQQFERPNTRPANAPQLAALRTDAKKKSRGDIYDWYYDADRLLRMKRAFERMRAWLEEDPVARHSWCTANPPECANRFAGSDVC